MMVRKPSAKEWHHPVKRNPPARKGALPTTIYRRYHDEKKPVILPSVPPRVLRTEAENEIICSMWQIHSLYPLALPQTQKAEFLQRQIGRLS